MTLPRRRIHTPPGVSIPRRFEQHTARFPVENQDGSETYYEVDVEWSVEVDGHGWWVLNSIRPPVANPELSRDLHERASLEAHDRMFPGVEA